MKFAIYNADTGQILQECEGPESAISDMAAALGLSYVECGGIRDAAAAMVVNGSVLPMPQRPSAYHDWDWAAKQWVDRRTQGDSQARAWARVKAGREASIDALVVQTARGLFQVDPASAEAIRTQLDLSFDEVEWKTADNEMVALTRAELTEILVAGAEARALIFREAESARRVIESGTLSVDELESIRPAG